MTTPLSLLLRRGTAAAALVLGAACAVPQGHPMNNASVPVLQQRHFTQCPWRGETAAVFDTEAAWRQALGTRAQEPVFDTPVDWSRQRVLVYTMDTQPTLGYGIELEKSSVTQRGDVLRLPVKLIRPSPDRLQATALSRPCLMVVVPRGDWKQLEVRDTEGDVLIGKAWVR